MSLAQNVFRPRAKMRGDESKQTVTSILNVGKSRWKWMRDHKRVQYVKCWLDSANKACLVLWSVSHPPYRKSKFSFNATYSATKIVEFCLSLWRNIESMVFSHWIKPTTNFAILSWTYFHYFVQDRFPFHFSCWEASGLVFFEAFHL